MEIIFLQFSIDFYLVGALARDIQLSSDAELASKRSTDDIDFAIMVEDEGQFYGIKNALIATGNFQAHETEAIKLFYKGAIEIDLMPFGDIEKGNRDILLTQPTRFVLNMPGFKEIYPFVEKLEVSEGLSIKVCSLEGLILLKLIANNDRPGRTKDITDIEHMIAVYFALHDGHIYEDHFDTMDKYSLTDREYLPLVCAHVIGREMNNLLVGSDVLKTRVRQILKARETTLWQAMLNGFNEDGLSA